MIIIYVVATINAVGWLLPIATEQIGWSLRARTLEFHQPYLAEERIWHNRLSVVLINQTKDDRKYLLLETANKIGDLTILVVRPNGKRLPAQLRPYESVFFEDRWKLPPKGYASAIFEFGDFGYHELSESGEYELRVSLKTAEGVAVAPVVKLTVIEPSVDSILTSQPVSLEGYQVKWPKTKQESAVVQQIKIGNRVWLVYRRFLSPELGGKVSSTFRLAELPGRCEVRIEGAFGSGKPLIITYKDPTTSAGATKLVINSTDGMPWTEEEERWLREREAARIAPAPRPVKP